MLKIKNVSIKFAKGSEVVSNVSMDISPKDKMVIIGETGSGKSVLLLSILRMLPSNTSVSGEIILENQNLLRANKKEIYEVRGKKIAYIPQGSGNGMNPLYTVGHQIRESLRKHRKISKREAMEKSVELLKNFGMENGREICSKYPFMLSGGMRQRALIAMGIANDADIILADEPTKGLDVERIKMVIDAFHKLEDKTILCVTHDLRFAKAIGSKITVMYASEQIECCTSEEFFSNPLHPYSKALIEALPENGLHASMGFAPPRSGGENKECCHFYHRCIYKTEKCLQSPPLIQYGHRKVRCWKYADENGEYK